jgi:hypothetical protein
VQRHPWLPGGAAVAVLLMLAVPFLSLRLAFTDAGTNPSSYTSRQAYDLLAEGFGRGPTGRWWWRSRWPLPVRALRKRWRRCGLTWPASRTSRSPARRSTARAGPRRCSP